MTDPVAIYRFLRDRRERGERVALLTLVGITGSAARALGTQVAVGESGVASGSFSAGCAEAAAVAEAHEAMRTGGTRVLRLGAGSPFMDVRLPCGGGIELLIVPDPPLDLLRRACALLEQRRPVLLQLSANSGVTAVRAAAGHERTGWRDGAFSCRQEPGMRLVVTGHGAEPLALLRLAAGLGTETVLLSPDAGCLAAAEAFGVRGTMLRGAMPRDAIDCDPHTAVVLLFHDHEREDQVLCWALEHEAFFVGAMGSRRTHAERCRRLSGLGVEADAIARIHGPVGLIEAARDPETLAVSVLAQVVAEHTRATRTRGGARFEPETGFRSPVPATDAASSRCPAA